MKHFLNTIASLPILSVHLSPFKTTSHHSVSVSSSSLLPRRACMFSFSMDFKRLSFPEPFLTPRRKVVSLCLVVAAYLMIFTLLLQNDSVPVSKVKFFLTPSCSASPSSSSSSVNESRQVDVSGIGDTTTLRNFTDNVKNASLHVGEQRALQRTHEEKLTLVSGKPTLLNSNMVGNSSEIVIHENRNTANTTHKSVEAESSKNSSFTSKIHNAANISHDVKSAKEYSIEKSNLSLIHHDVSQSKKTKKMVTFYEECDIFDGQWVRDDSKPYYPLGSCPHIDRDFNCHLNGRPEGEYVKWKWQPNGCDIPSLNATDFLERLRGQRLVFVGDSLNRNMWESIACIFRQSIRDKKRVYEISGRTEFKKKGFYAFRFEEYNCSVDFVASPFLVRESSFKGKNGTFETLRLDLMDKTTGMYHDADIIVFNTGHWWTHEKTSRGEEYYQEGNHVCPKLEVLEAYRRALTTWSRWVDRNININRTQVFFRGYSATHFSGGQWNSGGQCHRETEPIYNGTYLQAYPSKMRVVEEVIKKMRTPVMYMNISRLTDYRKDGHPSIYRMEYKSAAERNSAERYQDCSHWCLPGVPDAWNELLYASLLKFGKGTWKKL